MRILLMVFSFSCLFCIISNGQITKKNLNIYLGYSHDLSKEPYIHLERTFGGKFDKSKFKGFALSATYNISNQIAVKLEMPIISQPLEFKQQL